MKNRPGPCQDKQCSWCCDPVKLRYGFPEKQIPKDKDGDPLWVKRPEILIPKTAPDTDRIETFDCKNFEPETGLCADYDNRPDICRNSSCIKETSSEDPDEQHRKTVEEEFYKIELNSKTK